MSNKSMERDRQQFLAGMINACNVVVQKGIEGLKDEIRFRGVTKAPCTEKKDVCESWINEICNNVYNTMLADVGETLDADFGFRKERMRKFRECYEKRAKATLDMNWVGNHYVTLTDYAKAMNEKYGWFIELDVVENCQKNADKDLEDYKRVKLDRLIAELTDHGYGDAAEWLLKEWKEY